MGNVEAALFELLLAPVPAAVFFDNAAVKEVNRPIGVARVPRIVGNHERIQ